MPPSERTIRGVNDSKQLSPAERERLYPLILSRAVAFAIGAASVREIERHNPLQATVRAMHRALMRLPFVPETVLVDGRRLPTLTWAHHPIVRGDASCYCIACASVVAKVTRDRLMRLLSARYPGYGWEHNAGYGTAFHLGALDRLGPSPHHRATFLRTERGPKTGDGNEKCEESSALLETDLSV
jgi:ribonuclease HII